jgi:hypothetical protein
MGRDEMVLLLVSLVVPAVTAQPCPVPDAWSGPRPGESVVAFAHAFVQCVSADLDRYRWADVDRRLDSASAAEGLARQDALLWRGVTTRLRAARLVQAGDWPALLQIPASRWGDLEWLGDLVTGLAEARLAWAAQDRDGFARASAAARRLEARTRESDDPEIGRASIIVRAAVAGGQYEREDMRLLLDEAHRIEQQLATALDGLSVPVVIARELEADLLLQTDRYAEAADRYRDVLQVHRRRVHSWHGFAAASRRLGLLTAAAAAEDVAARLLGEP